MKRSLLVLIALILVLCSKVAFGQTCTGGTCVPAEDMAVFRQLLKDKKCQNDTKPTYKLDPITIVVDKEGRVYGSGADPHPYSIHMDWCNYSIDAKGNDAHLLVAKNEPPVWGFRFRPKFTAGFLPLQAINESSWYSGVDVGILWDFLYWNSLNVNVSTNIRSVGVGLGYDITKNFGAYGGYALAYKGWGSGSYAGLYFSFW